MANNSSKGSLYTEETLKALVDLYNKDPIKSLAMLLNQGAAQGVLELHSVIQKFAKPDEVSKLRASVYCEFLFFYTHLMNRNLDGEAGRDHAQEAIQAIIPEIFNLAAQKITKYDKDTSEVEIKKYLISNINLSENIYAQTTSFAGESNNDESSTVFQFRKRVTSLFGGHLDFLKSFEIDAAISASYIGFLTIVDFSEWVKGPIAQLGFKRYDSVSLFDDARSKQVIADSEKEYQRIRKQRGDE